MHANFSTCGAEGWLAPTGACAAPAWARWPYMEPWVATIAFFVWLALYKTLECGGDVRAAIRAQLEGDEKHVRIAGVGYFVGIYLQFRPRRAVSSNECVTSSPPFECNINLNHAINRLSAYRLRRRRRRTTHPWTHAAGGTCYQ